MFPEAFVLDKPTLNKALLEHMYRSGYCQSGELFQTEAKLQEEVSLEFKEKYKRLNMIQREMKNDRKVTLAL